MTLVLPPQHSLPELQFNARMQSGSASSSYPSLHSINQVTGGLQSFPSSSGLGIPDMSHLRVNPQDTYPISLSDLTQGPGQGMYLPTGPTSLLQVQPKRHLPELNHNKAITKQLVSATHYQQILDVVAQRVQIFDEVNVATALHRLARLQPPTANNQESPIVQTREFLMLVRAIRIHLIRFEAQAISNSMWAFATLSYFPPDNLLEEVANKAVSIMPSFRPQAVSNTLWAFAKLGFLPPQRLLLAVATQMHQDLPKSVPQDISNTLWAFATLRQTPGTDLLNASSQQALSMFHKFKPQEIANLLWSYATLDYSPPVPLLDAMAVQMVARIQSFRPQAVSNSLWAYAKIGYNPGTMLLDVAALKAATMFHQYSSQEVANTLWAVAALNYYPGHEMLNAAAIQFAKRLENFTSQDIASTLWAFAKLYHIACRGLLPGVALHVLKLWSRFAPTAIVTILESFAILQGCSLHTWAQLLAKLFAMPIASFTSDDLWHLYQTFLTLESSARSFGIATIRDYFPAELLNAAYLAWRATLHSKGWQSSTLQDISQNLWALGISHSLDEVISGDQLLVDCILHNSNIVIMMQEATDYSTGCRSMLGTAVAKMCMCEGQGYRPVSIPFYEWAQLATHEMKAAYLLQKLQAIPLPEPYLESSLPGRWPNAMQPAQTLQQSIAQAEAFGQLPLGGSQSYGSGFPSMADQLSMAQLSNVVSRMPLQAFPAGLGSEVSLGENTSFPHKEGTSSAAMSQPSLGATPESGEPSESAAPHTAAGSLTSWIAWKSGFMSSLPSVPTRS